MTGFTEKYINPFTDYGFKRLFGEASDNELMLDFLSELLRKQEGKLTEITYKPPKRLPPAFDNEGIDIYCTNEKGEKFIAEMQKAKPQRFTDRTFYYSSFPLRKKTKDQSEAWGLIPKQVYVVTMLEFSFPGGHSDPERYRYDMKMVDMDTGDDFQDELTLIYLSLEKFTKTPDELESRLEKWLYMIRHLHRLERIPEELHEEVFVRFFHQAEIARLEPEEYQRYEASLSFYRDIKAR